MKSDFGFFLKISLILITAFSVWYFGSSKKEAPINPEEAPARQLKGTSPALSDFVPPTVVVFSDTENTLPRHNWSAPALELQAEAALAMRADGGRVYYNKNMEARRPVASLTKLMTAIVVLENYNLNDVVKISRNNVESEGSKDDLRFDEKITARSLLNIMLINSSNNSALALADKRPDFISLMNKKTKDLGLHNTHFANPDGVDNDENYSSALDIAKIFSYLINTHPEILDILKTKNMVVYSDDGKIEHRLKNTNVLLGAISEIKAGKTGYTEMAGGSLALLISDLRFGDKNSIITVILGSPDRFGESEKLIQWLKKAYIW